MEPKDYISTFFYKNKWTVFLTVLVYIAESLLNILVSWYLQLLLDAIPAGTVASLTSFTVLFFALILVVTIIFIAKYLTYPKFLERAMVQYRDKAFRDLLSKNTASFSYEKTSTYLSAFTNDMISIQDNYLKNIFNFVQMIVLLVGSLSLMFFYSVSLTLIAIGLSLLPLLGSIFVGGKLAERQRVVSENNEIYVSSLKDILSGFNIIKTFQVEEDVHDQFDATSKKLEGAKKKANQTEELIQGIGGLTSTIAQIGVMLVGAYFVVSGFNQLTVGMVIAFTNLMNFVIQPLASIPQIIAERKAAKELVEKLSKNLQHNSEDSGTEILEKGSQPPRVTIDHVSYTYQDGNAGLKDVSFELEPGKIYGVVGGSGSGKSTLLNVLMKSYQDYAGHIFVDQHELSQITADSLYRSFSLIQQEVFIFDTTIENNVTMFKHLPQEQVDRAIEISGLAPLIAKRGQDYTVGENGHNLSGGERQRIAIARALIKDSSVIFVDEVTSALDNATAQKINQTLLALMNRTRVVVTHRLEAQTLKQFDQLFVMKNGEIIETGNFNDLMAEKGYFYSLYMVEN
ncbi:MAG: ABC transporter ATP-binding protein [Aerococcus sp.]|nr:ABC transporter ATP-binding protein [Aerococcus sp.]